MQSFYKINIGGCSVWLHYLLLMSQFGAPDSVSLFLWMFTGLDEFLRQPVLAGPIRQHFSKISSHLKMSVWCDVMFTCCTVQCTVYSVQCQCGGEGVSSHVTQFLVDSEGANISPWFTNTALPSQYLSTSVTEYNSTQVCIWSNPSSLSGTDFIGQ